MSLPPELQAVHDRLDTDLPYFMEEAPILVLDKKGHLVKFKLNQAQRFIHKKLEAQRAKTGMVRALILKGRQEGCSLYMTARNYHKVSRQMGMSALLISHQGQATSHLFSMISRYQKHTDPILQPVLGAANRTEMKLSDLESRFTVGTAGNDDVGRSGTNQLFHWSEAAYTDNAAAIQDGAMQTIPDMPGTEIVLESTANGPVGLFYNMCQDALNYILVFVPWWGMDEYQSLVDDNSEFTEEEQKYSDENFGACAETGQRDYSPKERRLKILWRRNKILEFADGGGFEKGVRKFRMIYPANPIEAFQASGEGLFNGGAITAARKSKLEDEAAPLVMGVDSAGNGPDGDRTIIVFRRGRRITDFITVPKQANMDMAVAGVCIREINARGVDMCFVDVGYGHGTIDRMHELGYRRVVQAVSFGEGAMRNDVFLNKRSEMICTFADWMNAGNVRIPDNDEFHSDLAVIPLDRSTSNGLRFIAPKAEIKKLHNGKSTDILDAAVLTFAYPVRRQNTGGPGSSDAGWKKKDAGKSPLKSRRR